MSALLTIRQEDALNFTRDGSFSLDKDGFIVTTDGQRVLSEQVSLCKCRSHETVGERELRLEDVKIDEFGNVTPRWVGQNLLKLAVSGLALFSDINELTPVGGNFFKANQASGPKPKSVGHFETLMVK